MYEFSVYTKDVIGLIVIEIAFNIIIPWSKID